jgi:hypothetical protein
MSPENRKKLASRVIKAAETALAAQHYVTPIDVLVGIGWLDLERSSAGGRGKSIILNVMFGRIYRAFQRP